jgi:probable rRNA maturation factor
MTKAGRVVPREPRLTVAIVGARVPQAATGLDRWVSMAAPRSAQGAVTIALVSDREMARLNHQFRGKRAATDVLSFPADDRQVLPAKSSRHNYLGDIAIARGVALRQSRALGHPLATELRVLALHGILHLLGYDHDRDRGEMRALEVRLRRRAGLPAGLIERAPRRTAR